MHNYNIFQPTYMRRETCETVYQKGSKNCISLVRLYIFDKTINYSSCKFRIRIGSPLLVAETTRIPRPFDETAKPVPARVEQYPC